MESEHHRDWSGTPTVCLQFEISISLSRNGERATVDVVAAVDARSGTVYGGFLIAAHVFALVYWIYRLATEKQQSQSQSQPQRRKAH
ncbi:hypothetical protein LWI29_003265 [Acer saccharum]|uniref:Uncharacterized protein n=1 Tax=Acer saccharum TaxID=4024 RepID=A0AA39V674_ACESA|nr:hypothetical protein LWI29_003265 [Acer saccharum]